MSQETAIVQEWQKRTAVRQRHRSAKIKVIERLLEICVEDVVAAHVEHKVSLIGLDRAWASVLIAAIDEHKELFRHAVRRILLLLPHIAENGAVQKAYRVNDARAKLTPKLGGT